MLADAWHSDADAVGTVEDLGDRGFAPPGAVPGSAGGSIEATGSENDAILFAARMGR